MSRLADGGIDRPGLRQLGHWLRRAGYNQGGARLQDVDEVPCIRADGPDSVLVRESRGEEHNEPPGYVAVLLDGDGDPTEGIAFQGGVINMRRRRLKGSPNVVEPKTEKVMFRCTQNDVLAFTEAARRAGVPLSEWARTVCHAALR